MSQTLFDTIELDTYSDTPNTVEIGKKSLKPEVKYHLQIESTASCWENTT